MKNASKYLDETLLSVILQTYDGPLELSIYDDASTDNSIEIVMNWLPMFKLYKIILVLNNNNINNNSNSKSEIYTHNIIEYQQLINSKKREGEEREGEEEEEIKKIIGSGGAGYSRNRAIRQSNGDYLCILDSDDIMYRDRVERQLQECNGDSNCLVGSNFIRIPEGSSNRYTDWCNRLTDHELVMHQYREITIIQPTWFLHRDVYDRIGGYPEAIKEGNDGGGKLDHRFYIMGNNENVSTFTHKNQEKHLQKQKERLEKTRVKEELESEGGLKAKAIPEDLIFFHRHLEQGGALKKISEPLLVYRYREESLSGQIHRLTLLKVKLEYLEKRVLSQWPQFSIWGAGRDGKKFFTMLSPTSKSKVQSFCDVDTKKIGNVYNAAYTPFSVPIIHFSQVKPPIIICVALDRSNGAFEENLNSLNLKEGIDYWHFN
eukprot:gene4538-5654_t